MTKFTFLIIAVLCPLASSAQRLVGDQAADLAYVLQETSLTEKVVSTDSILVTAPDIRCSQAVRGVTENLLPDYACFLGNKMVDKLEAKAVFDAFVAVGVRAEAGMSHLRFRVKNIRCEIGQNGKNTLKETPVCSFEN